jgi:predicted XRE-type DNA-binding protein
MNAKTKKIIKSSKQLADSLNLSPADAVEWEVRYSITNKIIDIVTNNKLTVTEVAKKAGTSRARITKILKGDSLGISLDILVKIVASLGHIIKLNFKKSA